MVLLMWMKMRRAAIPCERRKRAVRAVDRHVAHAAAGFLAGAGADHLVVGEQRAVEQNDIGARKSLAHRPASPPPRPARRRAARRRAQVRCRHWRRSPLAVAGVVAFQVERHLAGHHEQRRRDAARQRELRARTDCAPRHRGKRAEHGIGGDRGMTCRRGVKRERRALAQATGARRSDRSRRRSAPPRRSGCRAGRSRGCSAGVARICAAQIGRRVDERPAPVVGETARLACVRGLTRASPAQASWQTGQRQFHCGKPPPAAEPSTMAVRRPISPSGGARPVPGRCIRTRPADSR